MSRPSHSAGSKTATVEQRRDDEGPKQPHPDGAFEYGVVAVAGLIVVLSLYLSLRYLVAPGEKGESHIKRTILEEES